MLSNGNDVTHMYDLKFSGSFIKEVKKKVKFIFYILTQDIQKYYLNMHVINMKKLSWGR